MDGLTCRGHGPFGRERWPSSPLPYQEEPKVLCPGGVSEIIRVQLSSHSCLPAAPLAFWIPVDLKRKILVALTNINLQSLGCNFTLC